MLHHSVLCHATLLDLYYGSQHLIAYLIRINLKTSSSSHHNPSTYTHATITTSPFSMTVKSKYLTCRCTISLTEDVRTMPTVVRDRPHGRNRLKWAGACCQNRSTAGTECRTNSKVRLDPSVQRRSQGKIFK